MNPVTLFLPRQTPPAQPDTRPFPPVRRCEHGRARALAFAAGLCLASTAAWALDPNLPPGSNFDMSHWKLQLPTSNGIPTAASGSTDSATAAQLVAGFTNAYFYTGGDGAMVLWATNNGARTSGSTHPRSELREQLIPGNDGTNWTVYGNHVLTATCVLSNVPSDNGKVCIGQMHQPGTKTDGSPSANTEHLIMFDVGSSPPKIYVNINPDGNNGNSSSVTFLSGSGNVALGKPINYTMSIVDGLLKIIINNVTNSWGLLSGTNFGGDTFQNWDRASGNTLYFKAGSYNQVNNYALAGGARVAFTSLVRYHAANITNQPASRNVAAGGSSTFTVGASGNGTLGYQWWFNATNSLAGKTSSSLTLNSVSAANAGNYTVVVSDNTSSFSAITSAIATLTVTNAGGDAYTNYQATIAAQNPVYYFKLDNSLTNSGSAGPLTLAADGGGFTNGFSGLANKAGFFTASTDSLSTPTDIISGGSANLNGNPAASATGSVTLLFRTLDSTNLTGQRYLFAQRSSTTAASNALALFFEGTSDPGALKLRVGNGPTTVILSNSAVSTSAWYYAAATYNEARDADEVHWYVGALGGNLNSGIINIGNVAAVGDSSLPFVIGNSTNGGTGAFRSPGDGRIDEFAVWHRELTLTEIEEQFAAASQPAAPAITGQPASQIVAAGSNATFAVTATGTEPLAYQWRFNGTNRAGDTAALLTLNNVQGTNAGGYSVVVTNAYGSVTSAVATLTVQPSYPPQFIQYTLRPDGNPSMTATGAAGFAYRIWAGTNLAQTNSWVVLTGGTFGIAPVIVTDLAATNHPSRFYQTTIP